MVHPSLQVPFWDAKEFTPRLFAPGSSNVSDAGHSLKRVVKEGVVDSCEASAIRNKAGKERPGSGGEHPDPGWLFLAMAKGEGTSGRSGLRPDPYR